MRFEEVEVEESKKKKEGEDGKTSLLFSFSLCLLFSRLDSRLYGACHCCGDGAAHAKAKKKEGREGKMRGAKLKKRQERSDQRSHTISDLKKLVECGALKLPRRRSFPFCDDTEA